jgi:hypothetical protein
MATLRASAPLTRPMSVVAAVILSVLVILANFAGFALPTGGEEVPLIVILGSLIPGVAGIPAAIGLWLLRRWGYILTVIVTALNLLAAAPGPWLGPTVAIKIYSVAMAVASIAILALATRPEARRAYH